MPLRAVRAYARVYGFIKNRFGINLRGLGWMLRQVRVDDVIDLGSVKLYFDHRIATSYDLLVAGLPNEIETIDVLRRVVNPHTTVVDVGANVGELVLQIAPLAKSVIAYEPHPAAAAALRRSIELNSFSHVTIREQLVGDGGAYEFIVNVRNANASAAVKGNGVASVRLDDQLHDVDAPLILIIDVEGAEPLVVQGARDTIRRLNPLVIFEYNEVSKRSFDISEIQSLLGNQYRIFRLRRDGTLDAEVANAWNCIAIPRNSSFEALLNDHA